MRLAPRLNRTNHQCAFHTTVDNQYGRKKTNTKYRNTNQPFPSVLSAPILFFPANTPPNSHLKHPLFLSTGIGFVRTKHNQFFCRGDLTTIIQPQSTRGCGHLLGPGSQRLRTGLLCWQGGKGDSRDTSTFETSCPIWMSLPVDSSCEARFSFHFTQSGTDYQCQRQWASWMRRGPSTYWPTLGQECWTGTPWRGVGRGLV